MEGRQDRTTASARVRRACRCRGVAVAAAETPGVGDSGSALHGPAEPRDRRVTQKVGAARNTTFDCVVVGSTPPCLNARHSETLRPEAPPPNQQKSGVESCISTPQGEADADRENKREPRRAFAYSNPYTTHQSLTSPGSPGYTTKTGPLLFLRTRAEKRRTSDENTRTYVLVLHS